MLQHLTANEAGYKQFLEAVSEVSVAKTEACSGRSPDSSNRSQLLQEFVTAYQLEDESSLHSIRSLFGKLLYVLIALASSKADFIGIPTH